MLTLKTSPLTQPQQERLFQLWGSENFKTLKTVIEAKAYMLEIEAMKALAEMADHDAMELQANEAMIRARRYRNALSVLKEMESTQVFQIVNQINP